MESKTHGQSPGPLPWSPVLELNGRLETDRLKRQLQIYHDMGIGGATIHVRTGLTTPYLSQEYMDLLN